MLGVGESIFQILDPPLQPVAWQLETQKQSRMEMDGMTEGQ